MTELYWITRLDYIQGLFGAFSILTAIVIFVAILCYCSNDFNDEALKLRIIRVLKRTVPSLAIALSLFCFTPSTKDAMLIYGIGGTIDYIKSNDKAQKLPDKCIDALTRYVDSIEKDNKKTDNNKLKTL